MVGCIWVIVMRRSIGDWQRGAREVTQPSSSSPVIWPVPIYSYTQFSPTFDKIP